MSQPDFEGFRPDLDSLLARPTTTEEPLAEDAVVEDAVVEDTVVEDPLSEDAASTQDGGSSNLRSRVSSWISRADSDVKGPDGYETGRSRVGVGTKLGQLREVPVESIEANPYQPRSDFDSESLDELSESIRELGVLQPLLVRPREDGAFALIAGERRWRAARRAGLRRVPVIVRDTDDRATLEQAIVENLHRRDLNVLEEAAAFAQLMDDFGLTQDEVAGRVGKSRSAVANILRLLTLDARVQAMLAEGVLSSGHGKALLTLADGDDQVEAAAEIVSGGLSVRAAEKLVKERGNAEPGKKGSGKEASSTGRASDGPAWVLEVERRLQEQLDTRVEVQERAGTGKVVIRFADPDDLARILKLLERPYDR